MNRPICKACNKNFCAVNYIRKEKKYYRRLCDDCGRLSIKKKPRTHGWQKAGYKKKTTCDSCGFKATFATQMTIYYVDGNLENNEFINLRTICLNCVEVIKRKEIKWKRGDLEVD